MMKLPCHRGIYQGYLRNSWNVFVWSMISGLQSYTCYSSISFMLYLTRDNVCGHKHGIIKSQVHGNRLGWWLQEHRCLARWKIYLDWAPFNPIRQQYIFATCQHRTTNSTSIPAHQTFTPIFSVLLYVADFHA